jgi:hypothetical protein
MVAGWTSVGNDWDLVAIKSGPTRAGCIPLLKYFQLECRIPQCIEEFPQAAVDGGLMWRGPWRS